MAELPKDKTFGEFGFLFGNHATPMTKGEVTNDTRQKTKVSTRLSLDFWDNFCLWCLSNDDVDLAIRMGGSLASRSMNT